jgi:hypothetical protein
MRNSGMARSNTVLPPKIPNHLSGHFSSRMSRISSAVVCHSHVRSLGNPSSVAGSHCEPIRYRHSSCTGFVKRALKGRASTTICAETFKQFSSAQL